MTERDDRPPDVQVLAALLQETARQVNIVGGQPLTPPETNTAASTQRLGK
jgi:hypothetical protein